MDVETENRIVGIACFIATPTFALLSGYAEDMGWNSLSLASFLVSAWFALGFYASGRASRGK